MLSDIVYSMGDLLPDMVTLNIDEEYFVVYHSENAYDIFRKKEFEDGLRYRWSLFSAFGHGRFKIMFFRRFSRNGPCGIERRDCR